MVNGVDGGKDTLRYLVFGKLIDPFFHSSYGFWIIEREGEWENVAKFWAEDGARLRLAEFSARRRLEDNREWWWIIVER